MKCYVVATHTHKKKSALTSMGDGEKTRLKFYFPIFFAPGKKLPIFFFFSRPPKIYLLKTVGCAVVAVVKESHRRGNSILAASSSSSSPTAAAASVPLYCNLKCVHIILVWGGGALCQTHFFLHKSSAIIIQPLEETGQQIVGTSTRYRSNRVHLVYLG